jgi:hypothetical protein
LWFALELAKTLSISEGFTSNPPSEELNIKHVKQSGIVKPNNPINKLQPGVEAPVLPLGTFSVTPSIPPTLTTYAQTLELDLALEAKKKALDECNDMIDATIAELQAMAKAGERFWKDVKQLRNGKDGRGRWAVVPRPDFGRIAGQDEKARDIIVPYAVDEGECNLRRTCRSI